MDRRWKKNKSSGNNGDWNRSNSFMNKPEDGWLHRDDQLFSDAGVCYGVRVSHFFPLSALLNKIKKQNEQFFQSLLIYCFLFVSFTFYFITFNCHLFFFILLALISLVSDFLILFWVCFLFSPYSSHSLSFSSHSHSPYFSSMLVFTLFLYSISPCFSSFLLFIFYLCFLTFPFHFLFSFYL